MYQVPSKDRSATRACGYGSLAVSAWLLTAVATGHGVAAADDSSSSSSSAASSSASSSSSAASRTMPKSSRSSSKQPGVGAKRNANASPQPSNSAGGTGDPEKNDNTSASMSENSATTETSQDEEPDTTVDEPNTSVSPIPTDTKDGETPAVSEADDTSPAVPHEPSIVTGNSTTAIDVLSTPATPKSGKRPTARENSTEPKSTTISDQGSGGIGLPAATGAASKQSSVGTPWAEPSTFSANPTATTVVAPATATTAGQQITSPAAPTPPGPLGMIANAVNTFVTTIFSPLMNSLPPAPSGQNPFAWAVLAFVRRNFFNEAPKITAVTIGQQQANGVITGHIDVIDPDELGKTVKINANVYAAPAQPRVPEPGCECATVDGFQGLPFTNAASLGTAPGSTWYAPDAVDNTCVYIGADGRVTYTGTEKGEVTIAGLGTGDVTLAFEGLLLSATEERSVAQLQPHLGTGDLKGVRGTVISESTLDATGAAYGVLTGEVVRPELRYKVVRQAAHGTVVVDEISGQFTYTPDSAFAEQGGNDSFQIVVTDNRLNVLKIFRPYQGDPVQTVNLSVTSTRPTTNVAL